MFNGQLFAKKKPPKFCLTKQLLMALDDSLPIVEFLLQIARQYLQESKGSLTNPGEIFSDLYKVSGSISNFNLRRRSALNVQQAMMLRNDYV
ncbi:unnamed protein product [Allacma fusca]|uniref:Uncharacterized protein n=1 Tax=Allacma fusca TaxID=39272 RepID=A0A8J2NTQ5_9HEXA|nr:unnamed protein product [Allacma fusca]